MGVSEHTEGVNSAARQRLKHQDLNLKCVCVFFFLKLLFSVELINLSSLHLCKKQFGFLPF